MEIFFDLNFVNRLPLVYKLCSTVSKFYHVVILHARPPLFGVARWRYGSASSIHL